MTPAIISSISVTKNDSEKCREIAKYLYENPVGNKVEAGFILYLHSLADKIDRAIS